MTFGVWACGCCVLTSLPIVCFQESRAPAGTATGGEHQEGTSQWLSRRAATARSSCTHGGASCAMQGLCGWDAGGAGGRGLARRRLQEGVSPAEDWGARARAQVGCLAAAAATPAALCMGTCIRHAGALERSACMHQRACTHAGTHA